MRVVLRLLLALPALLATSAPLLAADVEQWGLFELALKGPADGNPFVDVEFAATFTQGKTRVPVTGFYDGDGAYRVRFMPETQGEWAYTTVSNRPELNGKTGKFTAVKPAPGNRGPV